MFLSWEPNDCTIISLCLKCYTRNKTKETEDGSLRVILKKVLKIHCIHGIHVKTIFFTFYWKSCKFTEPNVRAEIMSYGLEKSVICAILQKTIMIMSFQFCQLLCKYITEIPSSVRISLRIFFSFIMSDPEVHTLMLKVKYKHMPGSLSKLPISDKIIYYPQSYVICCSALWYNQMMDVIFSYYVYELTDWHSHFIIQWHRNPYIFCKSNFISLKFVLLYLWTICKGPLLISWRPSNIFTCF